MFCKKCGRLVEENSKFCSKCGTPVENTNTQTNFNSKEINNVETVKQPLNTNPVQNENYNNMQQNQSYNNTQQNQSYNNTQQNQNYDNIVNPSMKKYAVGCILVPILSIIVYWNIGLSSYVAILLAILGFNFSKKARLNYKTASTIGYVLNGILVAMAIFMIFAIAIERLA